MTSNSSSHDQLVTKPASAQSSQVWDAEKHERMRNEVIRELVETESAYVEHLRTIVQVSTQANYPLLAASRAEKTYCLTTRTTKCISLKQVTTHNTKKHSHPQYHRTLIMLTISGVHDSATPTRSVERAGDKQHLL